MAQGGEQEGLLKAKALTPSSQFTFNPGGEDVGAGLLHLRWGLTRCPGLDLVSDSALT